MSASACARACVRGSGRAGMWECLRARVCVCEGVCVGGVYVCVCGVGGGCLCVYAYVYVCVYGYGYG